MKVNIKEEKLARVITLPLLVLYGLGTILGAGIYVLVGKVSIDAQLSTPLAFLVAAIVALFTAISYAKLSTIFPKSAGEAVYVNKSFNNKYLTNIVGYLVILTGIVSSATLANGFVGYLSIFIDVNKSIAIIILISFFGVIAIWSIAKAVWLSALITIIEILGLLIVILYGGDVLFEHNYDLEQLLPQNYNAFLGVISGALIAFYAFIGFEDIVNVAEEVKHPEKTIKKAIYLSLAISSVFYIAIAFIAILSLPLAELASSDAPLTDIIKLKNPNAGVIIAAISLLAIVNGILVQLVMASRVLYGMGEKYGLATIAKINPSTKTPINATLIIIVMILVFALWLPLVPLAKLSSYIILIIFIAVNLSLYRLIRSKKYQQLNNESIVMPLTALVLCVTLILFQLF